MKSRKYGVKKKVFHFGIPSLRSLLDTIKIFLKATNNDGFVLYISMRFFHVYLFLQICIQ
jgi:hypothetical protein